MTHLSPIIAWSDALHWFVFDVYLKAALLLGATMVVALAIRRFTSASTRHFILLCGLMGALLTPVFSLTAWIHPLSTAPSRAVSGVIRSAEQSTLYKPQVAELPASAENAGRGVHPAASATVSRPQSVYIAIDLLLTTITVVWGAVLGMSLSLLIDIKRTRMDLHKLRLRCEYVMPSRPIGRLATDALKTMGITREVEVRMAKGSVAATVSTPMTWGHRHPVILLPESAETWPEERLRAALLHEASHIRRGDYLTTVLLTRISAALYVINPLTYLIARRLRIESEQASDDLVLTVGRMSGPDYARCLLDVAREARTHAPRAAIPMARSTRIEGRLASILNSGQDRHWIGRTARLSAVAVAATVAAVVSSLSFASNPNSSTEVVQLANGATVSVAAVSDPVDGNGDRWWRPNGVPTAALTGQTKLDLTPHSGEKIRTIAAMISFDPNDQPRELWADGCSPDGNSVLPYYPPDSSVWPVAANDEAHAAPLARWTIEKVTVHPSVKGVRIYTVRPKIMEDVQPHDDDDRLLEQRLTEQISATMHRCTDVNLAPLNFAAGDKDAELFEEVAAGPWTDTIIFPNRPGTTSVETRAGTAQITVAAKVEQGAILVHTTDWFGIGDEIERRLIVLDRNGNVVACLTSPDNISLSDRQEGLSFRVRTDGMFPASLLPRIAEFRLMLRPSQIVRIRNIQLEPASAR